MIPRKPALIAVLVALPTLISAAGDTCYYPNGDLVSGETVTACSSTKMCCPTGWDCWSNGLCYNPVEKFAGRYSCTDKTWDECSGFCRSEFGSSIGNQAVNRCANGQYCCTGNRSFDCCNTPGTTFFSLASNSNEVLPAMAVSSGMSSATRSSSSSTTDKTTVGTTATTSETSGSASTSTKQVNANNSASSASAFAAKATTRPVGSTISSANPAPSSRLNDDTSSQKKIIIGSVVGVLGFFALMFLIHWLRGRRQKKKEGGVDEFLSATEPGRMEKNEKRRKELGVGGNGSGTGSGSVDKSPASVAGSFAWIKKKAAASIASAKTSPDPATNGNGNSGAFAISPPIPQPAVPELQGYPMAGYGGHHAGIAELPGDGVMRPINGPQQMQQMQQMPQQVYSTPYGPDSFNQHTVPLAMPDQHQTYPGQRGYIAYPGPQPLNSNPPQPQPMIIAHHRDGRA